MRVYARQMIASVDLVLDRLERGAVRDSLALMLEISLRTIVESVFGVTELDRRERLVELIAVWVRMAQTEAMLASSLVFGGERVKRALDFAVGRSRARYGDRRPLSRNRIRRYCDAKAEIDDILRGEIERARTEGTAGREDILAKLVEVRDTEGRALADRQVFDHLISLLIGGNDTTALSLTWALHLLARHPEIAERVRAEVDACPAALAEARVEDLPYLDAVVSEVLRFRPVAQNIPRRTIGEFELGPWRLPPNTMVLPSLALAHFREDLWDRPFEFRPERFLSNGEGEREKVDAWRYFPFGGGSRTCIGRAFGLLELRLVLARMLQRARWEGLVEGEPTFAYRGAFLGPDRALPIRFAELRRG